MPRAQASSKPRENLRERILDAAVTLLRRDGHKKLTQTKVAAAAGIPQGHLTYYFPRRADLLLAVARRSVEKVAAEVNALGAALVRQHAPAISGFVVKDRPRTRMLLALLVEAGDDPKLRDTMAGGFAELRKLVATSLDIDPDHPDAYITVATLWGLGLQHLLLEGKVDDAHTDALLRRLADWRPS